MLSLVVSVIHTAISTTHTHVYTTYIFYTHGGLTLYMLYAYTNSTPSTRVHAPRATRSSQTPDQSQTAQENTYTHTYTYMQYKSPPMECIFGYIPFSRRWDTVRYSGIQLDTARYVRIQLDAVGHSEMQWICCKLDRYRIDTGIHGRPRIR